MTVPRPGSALTPRELDVLRAYVACDYDYGAAGRLTGISAHAAYQHIRNIRIRAGLPAGCMEPLRQFSERLLRRPRVVGLEPERLPW